MPASKPKPIPPTHDWKQLQLRLTWPDQQRYELIRPVVLFGQSAEERALETDAPVRTLYRHLRRFAASGLAGLTALDHRLPTHALPDDIRTLILTLKAEHPPLRTNEIATICYARTGRRPDRKTINRVLADAPPMPVATRRFPPFHAVADPARRRATNCHCGHWGTTNGSKLCVCPHPPCTDHAPLRQQVSKQHYPLTRYIRRNAGGNVSTVQQMIGQDDQTPSPTKLSFEVRIYVKDVLAEPGSGKPRHSEHM